jgi:hypothetical protein
MPGEAVATRTVSTPINEELSWISGLADTGAIACLWGIQRVRVRENPDAIRITP